ncbi:hypothetical protein [Streptomyces sp. NPDC001404]|uniref:hypothetical protein n=1 Tax=Streptomyces sp. NPDC001404 TaxID=3364571 RepID=UPI0036821657
MAAGQVHGWDAVRLPDTWGHRVLGELGEKTGAVIHDQLNNVYYWLVPASASPVRHLAEEYPVGVLGDGSSIAVPGPLRQRPLAWRVEPRLDRILTCPHALCTAIVAVGPSGNGRPAP